MKFQFQEKDYRNIVETTVMNFSASYMVITLRPMTVKPEVILSLGVPWAVNIAMEERIAKDALLTQVSQVKFSQLETNISEFERQKK